MRSAFIPSSADGMFQTLRAQIARGGVQLGSLLLASSKAEEKEK